MNSDINQLTIQLKKIITISIISISFLTIVSSAQETQNINLAISKVSARGTDYKTSRGVDGVWNYQDSKLTKDDAIKYQWDTVTISLRNKTNPAKNAGYLKVYKDNCDNKDNFLKDTGSDDYPFNLSKIDSELSEGANTLCFIYVNENNMKTKNFSFLKFNYSKLKPIINISSPTENQILSKEQNTNITIEVSDFSPTDKDVLNIYSNNDRNNSLIKLSNPIKNGDTYKYEINSSVITGLNNIPDSNDSVLNFEILNTVTGESLSEKNVKIITNYNSSLNSNKNPKLLIASPSKEVFNNINSNTKFIFTTENFFNLAGGTDPKTKKEGELEGYIQITINNTPISTKYPSNTFTLNDLKYIESKEKELEIKLKLVNQNYEKFNPEVTDTIKVTFTPEVPQKVVAKTPSNNQWQVMVIVATIFVILASVLVSIFRS
jgi:hypothetical protein